MCTWLAVALQLAAPHETIDSAEFCCRLAEVGHAPAVECLASWPPGSVTLAYYQFALAHHDWAKGHVALRPWSGIDTDRTARLVRLWDAIDDVARCANPFSRRKAWLRVESMVGSRAVWELDFPPPFLWEVARD